MALSHRTDFNLINEGTPLRWALSLPTDLKDMTLGKLRDDNPSRTVTPDRFDSQTIGHVGQNDGISWTRGMGHVGRNDGQKGTLGKTMDDLAKLGHSKGRFHVA